MLPLMDFEPVEVDRRACACGAALYMLRHWKTGKRAPITVERFEDGNATIDLEAGTYAIVGKGHPRPEGGLHRNHWIDCTAPEWQR